MKIYLEAEGHRIWMTSQFRGDLPARCESLPGSGWAKTKRHRDWSQTMLGYPAKGVWTYPLNFRTCLDIRREFRDEEIVIGPRLWAWAAAEKQKRDDLLKILTMEECETPILEQLYPELHDAVHNRPFQSVGIAFMKRARYAINADEPGLGKTLQAIGAIVEGEVTGPVLVIAPAAATTVTWPDEFDTWCPGEEYAVAEGDKEWRDKVLHDFWLWADSRPDKRSWLFINTEMLQNERPPTRARKPKAVSDAEWLGYADIDRCGVVLVKHDINSEALEGSLAWIAQEEYEEAMEAYDPSARRHPALFDREWSAVIVDEGQRLLPTKSGDIKKQSQQRAGVQKIVIAPNGMRFDLTGTPMKGNPLNLWGALAWLYPLQYTSYWAYVDRWFDVAEDEYSKTVVGVRPEVEDDYRAELDAFMIRRTKAEVAPWLPGKVYAGNRLDVRDMGSPVGVWLPMEGRQASAYQEMVEDAVAMLDSGQLMAAGILAEMTRCRQMASAFGDVEHVLRKKPNEDFKEWVDRYSPRFPSNKWDWLVEWLCERGITSPKEQWGDGKIIVASWQTSLLNLYSAEAKRLGIPHFKFTGGTSDRERREAKQTFQKPGGPRLMLLNTYAGGVSLSLDQQCDEMVILDETWVPDDQTQVEDRIHRLSRTEGRAAATYWYVRSRGTIEEHIAATTLGKDQIQKRLMDRTRGATFAKTLLTGG
jgi:SNF2 family DNA or RNA helicase